MFAREIRGSGGGMDQIKQDKSPLASHCHRSERTCTRGGVLQPFSKWKQGLWMGAGRNDLSFSRQCRQVPKPPERRGRPPNKHKKPTVTPTSQNTAPDVTFYAPKPTNNSVDENNSWSLTCDMKLATVPEKPAIIDNFRWINEQRTEGDAESSGSVLKVLSAKCGSGKKQGVSDENRRKHISFLNCRHLMMSFQYLALLTRRESYLYCYSAI